MLIRDRLRNGRLTFWRHNGATEVFRLSGGLRRMLNVMDTWNAAMIEYRNESELSA
jgi:hypothetical protein